MAPTAEEFARWRDDMVTRWVMQAHANMAGKAKGTWLSASWDGGQANPLLLKEMRVRADSYEGIIASTYEDYCDANGDEAIYE